MTLLGFTFSDVAVAAIVAGIVAALVGGLFQFGSTLVGKRILPRSEHLRNLAQQHTAEATAISQEVETLRDIVKTYREEVLFLRREVAELRPLRDEVLTLRRQVQAEQEETQRFRAGLLKDGLPEPPATGKGT